MSTSSMSNVGAFLAGAGLGGLGMILFLRHQYNDFVDAETLKRADYEKRAENLHIEQINNGLQNQNSLRLKYQDIMTVESKAVNIESKDSKGPKGAEGEGDFDLNTLSGFILNGKDFNALIRAKNIKLVKLLTESEEHFGFRYKTGLNTDTEPFNAAYNCFGGLYQTEIRNWKLHNHSNRLDAYTHYRPVLGYPDDTIVKIEDNKVKAHAVILGEPASLDDLDSK